MKSWKVNLKYDLIINKYTLYLLSSNFHKSWYIVLHAPYLCLLPPTDSRLLRFVIAIFCFQLHSRQKHKYQCHYSLGIANKKEAVTEFFFLAFHCLSLGQRTLSLLILFCAWISIFFLYQNKIIWIWQKRKKISKVKKALHLRYLTHYQIHTCRFCLCHSFWHNESERGEWKSWLKA